eukprot:272295-Prorocentrum_minimum.AAC.1
MPDRPAVAEETPPPTPDSTESDSPSTQAPSPSSRQTFQSRYHASFGAADSRIFLLHSILSWGGNAIWATFIMLKLERRVQWSWWLVFMPRWIAHAVHLPFQMLVLLFTSAIVERQLGPPPDPAAGERLNLHYEDLRKERMRTHMIVNTNSALHNLSLLIVKIVFCHQLVDVWEHGDEWGSFRLIFLPFWVSWFITNVLSFFKDKNSRGYGDVRELQYLFFLFVACKLDGINHYSWKVVFIIPWVAFGVMFMMASLILFMLLITRSPYTDRLLQVGILYMRMSFSLQFVSSTCGWSRLLPSRLPSLLTPRRAPGMQEEACTPEYGGLPFD